MLGRLVVLAVLVAVVWGKRVSYGGHQVLRLSPTATQSDVLAALQGTRGLDFWSLPRGASSTTDVMVAPSVFEDFTAFLDKHGIQRTVLIPDLQRTIDAEQSRQLKVPKAPAGRISFERYYRHSEINEYLDTLAVDYPDLVSVMSIGQSREGLDMKIIKISNGEANNRLIWVDGGIHGREWIGPAMVLYIIQQLVENAENGALLEGVDWQILPVHNPDGYEYTHTTDRMWRKTRSMDVSTECPGVDANRNWDFHWNEIGASLNPCELSYGGPNPFSEPENVNVRDYLFTEKDRLQLYIAFHSHGNFMLYPYGHTQNMPTNWVEMHDLAQEANTAQMAAGGNTYTIGSSANVLYFSSGTSKDYVEGVWGVNITYTLEMPGGGDYGFDLPADQIEPTVTPFFEAIKVFGRHIQNRP